MLTPNEADALLEQHVFLAPSEWAPLSDAGGRFLRRSILADRDLPPYDRATMDGIAVRLGENDRREFRVEGAAHAGEPRREVSGPEACLEIMTGAILPAGADSVIPIEQVRLENGAARVADPDRLRPGDYVHRQGSDYRRGAVLVEAGRRLTSRELAVAAGVGAAQLEVSVPPRVALVSTGDELVDVGEPVEPYQVRRSNTHALAALLEETGLGRPVAHHFADDRPALETGLDGLLAEHEIVVLSGGVSRGKKDFIPEVLEALGVETVFHRVAQRPGKPLFFGLRAGEPPVPVFGLPGNPLSTLVCGHRYLLPFLRRVAGCRAAQREGLALERPFVPVKGLALFLPVQRVPGPDATPVARPRTVRNSGDYASVVDTDGFIELPPHPRAFAAGEVFPYTPWE